jgi:hypothetical protein
MINTGSKDLAVEGSAIEGLAAAVRALPGKGSTVSALILFD